MSDDQFHRTQAEVRRSRWPGWIWAIPIAALAITIWLGVRSLARGGEDVTVSFDAAHGAEKGDTKVSLLGVEVGEVARVALDKGARGVEITLKLDRSVDKYLRTGTRFWMQGAKVSLSDPASLKSIVAGPQIIMVPGPGARARRFAGLEQPPKESPKGPQVPYLVRFAGAVGGLEPGAPVELRGFRVGEVTKVDLAYDAEAGALLTPVEIELEPDRLHIVGAAPPAGGDWRPIVDGMLQTLVAKGLRASLAQSPPFIGAREVDLDFAGSVHPAALTAHDGLTEIPATSSASIDSLTRTAAQVMSRADAVMAKVDAVPIDQIGENVRATTARIRTLVSSPRITDSLNHIDDTTRQVDQAVRSAAPQVGPLITRLRQTADQADGTVAAANRMLSGDAESQDSDLPAALHELTEAARSIRVLADTLQRHPEALIRGKSSQKGSR